MTYATAATHASDLQRVDLLAGEFRHVVKMLVVLAVWERLRIVTRPAIS